jgi:site-specific recombinase XerD
MNTKTIERYERCLRVNRKMSETSVKNYISDIKAFSEFVNKDLFEVTEEDVNKILEDYQKRNRRFGGV